MIGHHQSPTMLIMELPYERRTVWLYVLTVSSSYASLAAFRFTPIWMGSWYKIASSALIGVVFIARVILRQLNLWICVSHFLLLAKFSFGHQTVRAYIKIFFYKWCTHPINPLSLKSLGLTYRCPKAPEQYVGFPENFWYCSWKWSFHVGLESKCTPKYFSACTS